MMRPPEVRSSLSYVGLPGLLPMAEESRVVFSQNKQALIRKTILSHAGV